MEVLIEFLKVQELKYTAATGLGQLRDARAIPALLQAAREDSSTKIPFVRALGDIGSPDALDGLAELASTVEPTPENQRLLDEIERAEAAIRGKASGE